MVYIIIYCTIILSALNVHTKGNTSKSTLATLPAIRTSLVKSVTTVMGTVFCRIRLRIYCIIVFEHFLAHWQIGEDVLKQKQKQPKRSRLLQILV